MSRRKKSGVKNLSGSRYAAVKSPAVPRGNAFLQKRFKAGSLCCGKHRNACRDKQKNGKSFHIMSIGIGR
jgi:hypothetical protein